MYDAKIILPVDNVIEAINSLICFFNKQQFGRLYHQAAYDI